MPTLYLGVDPGAMLPNAVTVDTSTTGAAVELVFTYPDLADSNQQKQLLIHAIGAIQKRVMQNPFPGA